MRPAADQENRSGGAGRREARAAGPPGWALRHVDPDCPEADLDAMARLDDEYRQET